MALGLQFFALSMELNMLSDNEPKVAQLTKTMIDILDSAFSRLNSKDKSVSYRWLAQRTGLSPSYISKVFRGEKSLPLKLIPVLRQPLQLDHHEVEELQRLVLELIELRELNGSTGIRGRTPNPKRGLAIDYQTMGEEDLWLLDEWYYLAILNAVTLDDFENSDKWVAHHLGISALEAEQALQRLLEAGHLERTEEGRIVRNEMSIRFPTQRSHRKIRNHHKTMFEQAVAEISKVPTENDFKKRLLSGMTFAADPNKITQAKLILEKAALEAIEVLRQGHCSEVYQLNLQLFSLSKKTGE